MENTHKRPPLLSDEECFQMAGKWGEPIDQPEYCGGPIYYCVKEVSRLYEEKMARDAELIQRLVNGLKHAQKFAEEYGYGPLETVQWDLDTAAAAGFKPTEE